MHQMSNEEFERAIEEALDGLPPQFLEALENVAVVWEEEPSAYHLGYEGDEWGDGAPWSEADDEGFGSWDAAAVNDGLRDATGDERDGEGDLNGDRLPDDLPCSRAPTSAASATATRWWPKSARPSSTSWATTSAWTKTSSPPWATSKT